MNEFNTSKAGRWLSRITVALIALSVFLIPFGTSSQIPCGLLAFAGVGTLVLTRGAILKDVNMRRFTALILCYALPIALSIIGAVKTKSPIKVLSMALISYLSGIAIIYVCRDERTRKRVMTCFAATVAFWVADALFQAIAGFDIFGFRPARLRLGGPFTTQYMLGAYLGSLSALLIFYGLIKKWPLHINLFVYLLTSIIVMLSNTRTGWVMYAIVSAVFLYHALFKPIKRRIPLFIFILLAGAVTATGLYKFNPAFAQRIEQTKFAFNGNLDSLEDALSGRLRIWITAINVIKDNPINGIGARNFRHVYTVYMPQREYGSYKDALAIKGTTHPHQLLLEVTAETGMIGLTGLFIMYFLFWRAWKNGTAQQRFHTIPIAALILAAYFPLNTHSAHYSSQYSMILWLMIALYLAFLGNDWTDAPKKSV